MKAQIKLFRIFGIQIGLNYSWLLIAVLVVLSLAGQFAATNPHLRLKERTSYQSPCQLTRWPLTYS